MPPEKPQATRQLITTRAEYLTALDTLLPLARESIWIFEPDLTAFDFNAEARIKQLRAFLHSRRDNTLHIALHDATDIARKASRLTRLLADFPMAIAIYRTEGEASRAQDCFVLIDARHFVRRPVAQQSRGVFALHEPHEGRQLADRFDEIRASSEPAVSATTLGLL